MLRLIVLRLMLSLVSRQMTPICFSVPGIASSAVLLFIVLSNVL
jgi:hypothetical protein